MNTAVYLAMTIPGFIAMLAAILIPSIYPRYWTATRRRRMSVVAVFITGWLLLVIPVARGLVATL